MKRTKSKREYVVGYEGEENAVHGWDDTTRTNSMRWADRMTLYAAQQRLMQFPRTDSTHVIYRLVPAETYGPGEMPPKEARKKPQAHNRRVRARKGKR